jgi:hypothetical protein
VLKKVSAPTRREQNKTPDQSSIRIVRLARHRLRLYDETVRQALIALWEASDRACSKRLKDLVPTLLAALERHQHLRLDPATRMKLTAVSAATIDRMLSEARSASLNARAHRSPIIPHCSMPIHILSKWESAPPGYVCLQLDFPFVRPSADHREGVLTLVDLFSGWTQHAPLLAREPTVMIQTLSELCDRLPFTLRGIAVSSDLEFSAVALEQHCTVLGLEFTRQRTATRNEPTMSSQTTASAALPRLGDRPLEGAALDALSRLHASSSLFVNFFQSSFRLKEKHRLGSRTVKRVHTLGTPCTRLLLSSDLAAEQKTQLRHQAESLDPLQLLDEARQMRSHLALLSAGFQLHTPSSRHIGPAGGEPLNAAPPDLPALQGEAVARVRSWRTHEDAFEAAWPTLQAWLHVDPAQTSKNLFERLRREFPGVYREGQLRSLQRRLRNWRSRKDCRDGAAS